MRGLIVIALGAFLIIASVYDSRDGEFTISKRSGGGRVIYEDENPSAYRKAVVGEALLGLIGCGLGYWVWRREKR